MPFTDDFDPIDGPDANWELFGEDPADVFRNDRFQPIAASSAGIRLQGIGASGSVGRIEFEWDWFIDTNPATAVGITTGGSFERQMRVIGFNQLELDITQFPATSFLIFYNPGPRPWTLRPQIGFDYNVNTNQVTSIDYTIAGAGPETDSRAITGGVNDWCRLAAIWLRSGGAMSDGSGWIDNVSVVRG